MFNIYFYVYVYFISIKYKSYMCACVLKKNYRTEKSAEYNPGVNFPFKETIAALAWSIVPIYKGCGLIPGQGT